MHIHRNHPNLGVTNPFMAAAAEKAAASERAAKARRKLSKSGATIEGYFIAEQDRMIGQWMAPQTGVSKGRARRKLDGEPVTR